MREEPLSWSWGWRPQNDTGERGQVQNVKMSRGEKDGPKPTQEGPGPTGVDGPYNKDSTVKTSGSRGVYGKLHAHF
jgi:hypothetical protein